MDQGFSDSLSFFRRHHLEASHLFPSQFLPCMLPVTEIDSLRACCFSCPLVKLEAVVFSCACQ